MRLMGLVWTDAPRARVNAAIKDVRDRQEASGGWSQFGRTAPDAYATGLSLYALHVAGVPATDDDVPEGCGVPAQHAVSGRNLAGEDALLPGPAILRKRIPLRRHQWISTAGTSWASLAIAQTLPDTR